MTALAVGENEIGVIRVFALDLPERDLRKLTNPGKTDPNPQATVAMLVGLDWLQDGGFEIFDPEVLGDLGLSGYLRDGGGVAAAALTKDQTRLDAVQGPVLILYSRAFSGQACTLKPAPCLSHIGTYAEDTPPVHFEKLTSDASVGVATGAPGSDPTKPNPHLTLLMAILVLPLLAIILGAIYLMVIR
ncbi:hypothetical protein [Shimia sp.]|uniref:hypothetical protein n=1 Tax=Shimia sp. TaxID=1954381 RepID=UPI00329A6A14